MGISKVFSVSYSSKENVFKCFLQFKKSNIARSNVISSAYIIVFTLSQTESNISINVGL